MMYTMNSSRAAEVFEETWGHLRGAHGRIYPGTLLFAVTAWGGLMEIRVESGDADSDALHAMSDEDPAPLVLRVDGKLKYKSAQAPHWVQD